MTTVASRSVTATSSRSALIVAVVANLTVQIDAIVMFSVYPEILRAFGGTAEATLSWILNAYTITFAACLVPAGRLADRFGRRQLFLIGTVLYGLGAGLCGISPSSDLLITARVVQGLGAALLIPTSLALVLVAFAPARRAGAVNQWVAGGAIGGVIAPTLGGIIVMTIGWRWIFFVSLLFGALAFALGRRFLVETERDDAEPMPDMLGLALLIAGLSLLALGIVRGDGLAVAGIGREFTVALGVIFLGCFGLRSIRVANPAVDLALLADRVRAPASVAMFLFGATFASMFLSFNLFLTRVWHLTIFEAGLIITMGPTTAMLTATIARRLADRHGHRSLLLPGAAAYAAGSLLFVQAVAGPADLFAYWAPAMVIAGIGVGLLLAALSGLTVFGLPQSQFAVGAGVSQAIRQLGSVIGVALLVALQQAFDPATAFSLNFALGTGCGVLIALLALPIIRSTSPVSNRTPATEMVRQAPVLSVVPRPEVPRQQE